MSTEVLLYWITRCDVVLTVAAVGSVVTGFVAFIGVAFMFSDEDDTCKLGQRILKRFVPALALFVAVMVFVPSTRNALIIAGVGGTVEYLKSNETAKQLPDKAIKVLDKLVDEYLEEEPADE